jgi:iron(III) transport system ATP-binding protein
MASIRIENLVVGYAEQPVIQNLSLTIEDGSLFTLLGPSGCGKTTLLRAIAGFVPIRSGRLFFGERDVTSLPAYQRDIGFVFQDYALFPDKTVFENVAYGLKARNIDGAKLQTSVSQTLERVGLTGMEQRLPAALSGGQRQRVALARALAIKPTVLLMDEPLSNLDAKLRHQVRETIADLQREVGITTVLVTHDQEEALVLSDQIGLLRHGTLEQVGSPQNLYADPVSVYAADFVGAANVLPVNIASAASKNNVANIELDGLKLSVRATVDLPVGPASLIARGETLRLVSNAANIGPSDAHLQVTVVRRQYLGSQIEYLVQLASGARVWVNSPSASSEQILVGENANLVFDQSALRLVPL